MNKIITIGREFGSGGRQLGKLLAETLGYAYYDEEIIEAIAKRSELAEDYVRQVVENRIMTYSPITVANTLTASPGDSIYAINRSIFTAQTEILEEMAQKSDCVIVGRCADYILEEYKPFRLFVYADMETKMARCRAKGEDDAANDKELEKKIRAVEKARAQYYRFYTGRDLSDRLSYDLGVNTTGREIADVAAAVAALIRAMQ